jgi:hypothetical protein
MRRHIKTAIKRPSIQPIACQLRAMILHFLESARFRGIPDPTPDYWPSDYERLVTIANELAALLQRRVLELSADDWCGEEECGA